MSSIFQFSNVSFLYEMLRTAFDGIEWFLILYFICIAGFYVIGKETLNLAFLYPFLFMLVTIFNPFLIVPLASVIGLTSRIRRLFWLVPVNPVLACLFAWLCSTHRMRCLREFRTAAGLWHTPHDPGRWKWLLSVVFCVLFIVTLGTSAEPYLRMPQNIYKTSNEVRTISSIIADDALATGIEEKRTLYTSQQLLELRQYDPSIRGVLRRYDLLDWSIDPEDQTAVEKVLRSNHTQHHLTLVSRYGLQIDPAVFKKDVERFNIYYIVAHMDMELSEYYESNGFEKIGQAGEFEVFRNKDV